MSGKQQPWLQAERARCRVEAYEFALNALYRWPIDKVFAMLDEKVAQHRALLKAARKGDPLVTMTAREIKNWRECDAHNQALHEAQSDASGLGIDNQATKRT